MRWKEGNMIKKVAIISLSRGLLGEDFVKHEVEIGVRRLKECGLEVVTTKNALKGMDFIAKHPELRANDLLDALNDGSIDMIISAIGGDDTYRLLPFLFENDELKNTVRNSKKIFLGYSDTTMNHFMFYKAGLNTFYGQSFLPDVCELEKEMLPYSKSYFEELINTKTIKSITPSKIWYTERENFTPSQINVKRIQHQNKGFELLQGNPVFRGKILGGCIETIYDIFDNTRYSDSVVLCKKYKLFPSLEEWKGKILLLESSEEQTKPELYIKMIQTLQATGIFNVINGILVGKPFNEIYYEEYKNILIAEVQNKDLPIVYNVNIGHSTPKCIIPFGINAEVNVDKQVIQFIG